MEIHMIKRLVLILIAVASYGQGMSNGPFTLGDSKEIARRHCTSMTTIDSVNYTVTVREDDYHLVFENNQLWLIEQQYSGKKDDYIAAVLHLSEYTGRRPDRRAPLENEHFSTWVGRHSSLVISYNFKTNLISIHLVDTRE